MNGTRGKILRDIFALSACFACSARLLAEGGQRRFTLGEGAGGLIAARGVDEAGHVLELMRRSTSSEE